MAGTQLAMAMQRANEVAIKLGYSSGDLIDVLDRMNKEGYTAADIMEMFGIRAGRAALILATQTKEARELANTLQTVGGEAQVLADKMSSSAKSALGRLKGLWASLGDAVYATYETKLIEIMDGMWKWIDKNRAAIVGFLSAVMSVIVAVIDAFAWLGRVLAECGTAFTDAFSGIPSKLKEVETAAATTAAAFAADFVPPPMDKWDQVLLDVSMGWHDFSQRLLAEAKFIAATLAYLVRLISQAIWNVGRFVRAGIEVLDKQDAVYQAFRKSAATGFTGKEEAKALADARAEAGKALKDLWADDKSAAQDYADAINKIQDEFEAAKNPRTSQQEWDYRKGLPQQRQFLDVARKDNEAYFNEILASAKWYADQEGMTEAKLAEAKRGIWEQYEINRRDMLAQEIADGRAKFALDEKDAKKLTAAFELQMKEQQKLFMKGQDYSKATILPKGGKTPEELKAEEDARKKFLKEELETYRDLLKSGSVSAEQLAVVWSGYYDRQSEAIEVWRKEFIAAGGSVFVANRAVAEKMGALFAEKPEALTMQREYPLAPGFEGRAAQDRAMFEASTAEINIKNAEIDIEKEKAAKKLEADKVTAERWASIADEGFTNIGNMTAGFFTTEEGKWAEFHRNLLTTTGQFVAKILLQMIDAAAGGKAGGSAGGSLVSWIGKVYRGTKGGGEGETPSVDVGTPYTPGGGGGGAAGGITSGPTRLLIGEAGPEALIPLSKFRDQSFLDRLVGGGGGGSRGSARPVVINIQTPDPRSFKSSSSQIAARMALAVRQADRNL
jgi:hypothetical protein